LADLKALNTVYKAEYTKLVLEEDTTLQQYLKQVDTKVETAGNDAAELIWAIEDTNHVWD
jgi:hypothetical protein